jgi:hypothetical protein
MKWFARSLAVLAVLGLAAAAPAHAEGKKASVKVVNQSDWEIHHMYMAPADNDDWGPDQLGKDQIIKAKGGTFTLTDIPCNTWDIKIADEDGDECVVESVDVCKEALQWTITSKDLIKCQNN